MFISSCFGHIILTVVGLYWHFGSCVPPSTLNIGDNIYSENVVFFHEKISGVSISSYLTSRAENVTRVLDSGSIIWESDEPNCRLSIMKMYRRDKRNMIAVLFIINQFSYSSVYKEKKGYTWYDIPDFVYQIKLMKLFKERILDISEEANSDVYFVQEHNFYGLPARVILPRAKFEVISVVNDFDTIWTKETESSKCTAAILHGHKNNIKLIHLYINGSSFQNQIFFLKLKREYITVNKDLFYRILDKLDAQEIARRNFDNHDTK